MLESKSNYRLQQTAGVPTQACLSSPDVPFDRASTGHGSDDPKDPNYNRRGLGPDYAFSHEALRRADRLYDIIGVMDFNYPDPKPGDGSAIFVHQWRKPRQSTEGCIAFAPEVLRFIAQTWQEQSRVVVRG